MRASFAAKGNRIVVRVIWNQLICFLHADKNEQKFIILLPLACVLLSVDCARSAGRSCSGANGTWRSTTKFSKPGNKADSSRKYCSRLRRRRQYRECRGVVSDLRCRYVAFSTATGVGTKQPSFLELFDWSGSPTPRHSTVK